MVSFGTFRSLTLTCLLSVSATAGLFILRSPSVQAQTVALQEDALAQAVDATEGDLRPLAQEGSLLSIQGGQRLMSEAQSAVSAQNYDLAAVKLREARQVFNQLSNFYQGLASSFSGIDNRIADAQRLQALETAQMRDQATYQLALVHRAQNQPDLAVPLLVQIIQSQQPTRDLGQRAYQQLLELGFVDSAYPREQDDEPAESDPSALNP